MDISSLIVAVDGVPIQNTSWFATQGFGSSFSFLVWSCGGI